MLRNPSRALILAGLALLVAAGAMKRRRSSKTVKAGIQWAALPGGTFTMGASSREEGPPHRVKIKSFEMAKTLVTNKQYKACMAAGACTAPADKGGRFERGDVPVVGLDFNQVEAFCAWAGGRLPSEAEWEYAARSAGKVRRFPWGDEPADCERGVFDDCAAATMPVCSKPKGNTEQGLCDMSGNVQQWTADWHHDTYEGAPTDGSAWVAGGSFRVTRGSSWNENANFGSTTYRRLVDPLYRFYYYGFRPVRL